MAQRRLKIEDAHEPPDTADADQNGERPDHPRGVEWLRQVDPRAYQEERSHALPPPHGLRYGSSFPYSAVVGLDRQTYESIHRDRGDPEEYGQRRRHFAEAHDSFSYPPSHQIKEEEVDASWLPSWQYRVEEEQLRCDRDEDGQFSGRHGLMPSLDSMLRRPRPADRHDSHDHDAWRSESAPLHHTVQQARPHSDAMRTTAIPTFERYDHDHVYGHAAAASATHRVPLPGIRRLSSLTDRRSPVEFSRSRARSVQDNPSHSTAFPPISSEEEDHHGVHPVVAQLRSTGYNSPHTLSNQRLSQPRNWSSPASDAASPMGSPAKRSPAASDEGDDDSGGDAAAEPLRKKKKRKTRICTTAGCDKLVVDHGVCIRHGGGKRCNVEGCDCRAQNKGLCWKHGGYTICQIDGCDKRAKSRGMCWSHGGGTQCKTDGCEKIAVSRGRCWAHGGGKRCKLPDCQKPAAQRMNDFCSEHYAAYRATHAVAADTRREHGLRGLYDTWQ